MRSSTAARADSSRVMRRPVAEPPACTMRRREWPPSRPSARLPWRSASKLTPSRSRSRTRAGDSSHSTRTALSRAASRPAARVSWMCCSGESSSARAAAIPPWAQNEAVCASGERLTSATRAPRLGGGQGGVQARGTGADHRHVHSQRVRGSHRRYRTGARAPSTSAIPRRSSTTPAPATRSGPTGSRRSRRSFSGATGSASSGARRRRPRPSSCWRCTPRATSTTSGRPARGRGPSTSTLPPRPAPGTRRCTQRAAPAPWSRRCSAGSGRASRRCARPATTPSTRARWGSACSRTSRSPPGTRSHSGPSACSCSTGTCTTATAPTRSSTSRRRCCSRASTSTRSGPARGRCRTSAPGPARATRSTCRCRRAPARTSSAGWSSTWCCRPRGRSTPTWCSSRPATTRIATTRSASARSRPRHTGELARQIRSLGKPVGYVLEGGYDLGALAASVAASMEDLTSEAAPSSFPRGALVEQATAVVGRHWEL